MSLRPAGTVSCAAMTQYPQYPHAQPVAYQQPPRKSRWWVWVLVSASIILGVGCLGCVGVLAWIGARSPELSVYAGNEVPARYVSSMRDVGALDPDERITYFYSDAISNILEGFSFVSDRKVATYGRNNQPPLTVVEFDDIVDVQLYRDMSLFVDSEIVLELTDGTPVSFPVSSTNDGDVRFLDAIRAKTRIGDE